MRDAIVQRLQSKGLSQASIEKISRVVDETAQELIEAVQAIESSPMTTRNHYGRYLSFFGGVDKTTATFLALALEQAGGNYQGIRDAFNICYR